MENGKKLMIEKRAYELFMARGYQHGNDMSDWLTAEKEVLHSPGTKGKKKVRRVKK
jgi:hypothetical protein